MPEDRLTNDCLHPASHFIAVERIIFIVSVNNKPLLVAEVFITYNCNHDEQHQSIPQICVYVVFYGLKMGSMFS